MAGKVNKISEGMKEAWKKRKEQPNLWQELVESQKAHIKDLQEQIERLSDLVQILSDDKFFKPQILEKPLEPTKTEGVFQTSDYEFQTSVEAEPEDTDIAYEIAELQQKYAEQR